jgi:hypothetical protein
MDFRAPDRRELVATGGGTPLGISPFLSWYSLGDRNARLDGCSGPSSRFRAVV